ncbi:MAG: hypothetical protein VR69_07155 [Peptococcaceae bacterium BRH_c4b]|nr:MAG: hypothetical protein VR69_07155 [Peptococcaceae bacterium BRH_c4b]
MKANSKIESFAILAILTGSVAGGYLSDHSVLLSLLVCLFLYGLSIVFNTHQQNKIPGTIRELYLKHFI